MLIGKMHFRGLVAGALLGGIGAAAHGATITGYTVTGNGNGTASVSFLTLRGNPTEIVITGKNFTGLGPIDITFTTVNSGAAVSYSVGEGVTNSTGVTWTDYHEKLGSGAGNLFTIANTPTTFVGPASNSISPVGSFTMTQLAPYTIDFSQGSVTNGNTLSIGFGLNVPDVTGQVGTVGSFTLRQFPSVPEPTSIGLISLGVFGLLARRRRY